MLARLAHTPNYTFAEVARYLRMPPSTVRYWAKGGPVTKPSGRIHFDQVLHGPPRQRLSFNDLTELLVVRELRDRFNLRLGAIRSAQEYVRQELDRPWYLYQLGVLGSDIFIQNIDVAPVAATRSGQMAFEGLLDDLIQRVESDASGLASKIFPRVPSSHEPRPVQISPIVSFGDPTVAGTGIRTATIGARFDAGEELADIAADYDLPIELVEDAVAFGAIAA